jgi:hypothetical protein
VSEAIAITTAHRDTQMPAEHSEVLANEFWQLKQDQWKAFLRTAGVAVAPQNLVVVLEELRAFLLPVLQTVSQDQPLRGAWRAPGQWTNQGAGS